MGILLRQGVKTGLILRRDDTAFILKDEVGAADKDPFPIDITDNTVGHQILYLGMELIMGQSPLFGFLYDCVGHGVGKMLFQASRQPQHFCFLPSAEGNDSLHPGAGVGQGAGLVKDNDIRCRHGFQELAALDGDMGLACLPHGRQHRQRHGQLQSAGEVHHQHRQRPGHIASQEKAQNAARKGVRHQLVGQVSGFALGSRLHLFRLLDHLHDLVIAALAGGLLDLHHTLAFLYHRTGINSAAGTFGHGDGLSRKGCLIDGHFALQDYAVQRNDTAGPDHHRVSGLDLGHRYQHFALRCAHPDSIYIQGHTPGQILHGFLPGPLFQKFSQLQQEHYRTSRSEVSAADRNGNGQSIQQFHLDTAAKQTVQSATHKGDHMPQDAGNPQGRRQEQGAGRLDGHLSHQLFLKTPVEGPAAVGRQCNALFRLLPGKPSDVFQNGLPIPSIV